MAKIGAYEAKTHLPRLIERARQGERFTITRRGIPVAELTPPGGARDGLAGAAVAAMRRFRRGRRLGGEDLRKLIEEGRR